MSDPPKRLDVDTVPPPSGEEDLYSASTKVGQASDEILALVRASEQSTAEKEAAKRASQPGASNEDEKLQAMKEAAARAAKQAVANEVAREATKAAVSGAPPPPSLKPLAAKSAPPASAASAASEPPAVKPAPRAVEVAAPAPAPAAPVAAAPALAALAAPAVAASAPVANPTPRVRAQSDTTRRPAVKTGDEPRPAGGLPPVVAILLVFVAATLALAALVR